MSSLPLLSSTPPFLQQLMLGSVTRNLLYIPSNIKYNSALFLGTFIANSGNRVPGCLSLSTINALEWKIYHFIEALGSGAQLRLSLLFSVPL